LIPIFLTFVGTHVLLILGGILVHLPRVSMVAQDVHYGFQSGLTQLGGWGLFLVFLHAYSLGGGTYTGIEAVSNGVGILREPKVETGKRTMTYMAMSLAFTAGGLLLCYMLVGVRPVEGQTLNAALTKELWGNMQWGGLQIGTLLVLITIASEAVLLLVAAQMGFIDGPRVMANMATDSWIPRRFAAVSDRLTSQNGILLFGLAAMVTLAYTRGHIGILVVMYSVNVFLTFSLSEIGMISFWLKHRKTEPTWKKDLAIHTIGFILCFSILWVMVIEKFGEGAWVTALITIACIGLCFLIRRHYRHVASAIKQINRTFEDLPVALDTRTPELNPEQPTAVILMGGYSGLGIHILLNIFRHFPETFKNVVFLTVGVVTSEFFKGGHHIDVLTKRTEETLKSYAEFAKNMGVPATSEYQIGAEVVETASELCIEAAKKYPRCVFFAGELMFENSQWYHKILHNEMAYAILRRIRFAGLPMVILPIRIR